MIVAKSRFLSGVSAACAALTALALQACATAPQSAPTPRLVEGGEFWQSPVIKGVGEVHPLPDAAFQPQADQTYKIVFSASKPAEKPTDVVPGLEHAARAINVYAGSGVPLSHLKFVVVLFGPAARGALDNAHYKAINNVDNPNLALIHTLTEDGVQVVLCGQSASAAVSSGKADFNSFDPEVKLALSALTAIPMLQAQGYALMQY